MADRQVGLRDHDREVAEPLFLEQLKILCGRFLDRDPVRAVDLRCDRLDLADKRFRHIVGITEVRLLLAGGQDFAREIRRAGAAVHDVGRDRAADTSFRGDRLDLSQVGLVIVRERVDRHDRLHAERLHDLDVLDQVRGASADILGRLLEQVLGQRSARHDAIPPGMRLQRPDRGDEDRDIRSQPRDPALHVEEALGSHVGAKACLGEHEVCRADPDLIGDDRGVARRNIAERARVDQDRRVLGGLEQIRPGGIFQDHGHRAVGLEIRRRDEVTHAVAPDYDSRETLLQVLE